MLAEELKSMNIKQLGELAAKLRGELISGVRAGGGHLASNLGVGGGEGGTADGVGLEYE